MTLDELREFLERERYEEFPFNEEKAAAAIALVDKLRRQQREDYVCVWLPNGEAKTLRAAADYYTLPVLQREEA